MTFRRSFAVAGVTLGVCSASPSYAAELHQTRDEARIVLDASGTGTVEHHLGVSVAAGPAKSLEFGPVDPGAKVVGAIEVRSEDGTNTPAQATITADRMLRVALDGRGLKRGRHTVVVRYHADFVENQKLARDGVLLRFAWTSPLAPDGIDGVRVVVDVPGAPTEPQLVRAVAGLGDDAVFSNLRRGVERDELELVRPHVSRGEAATWAVRLDPRAFPAVKSLAPPPAELAPTKARSLSFGAIASAAFAALVVFAAAFKKSALVARCNDAPRPLVRLAGFWQASSAAVAFGAGAAFELAERPVVGACAIAACLALLSYRTSRTKPSPRGPGKWFIRPPETALARIDAPDAPFDALTRTGFAVFCASAALLIGLAALLARFDAQAPYLVALDSAVLLPLFFTGGHRHRAPNLAIAPRTRLARLLRALKKRRGLRVVPWARVPLGTSTPDEIRLLALPSEALPGFVGIEVGMVYAPTSTGYAERGEVLVRVRDESPAAARIRLLAPFARVVPGRTVSERVYRLVPRVPTDSGLRALVERLVRELQERRRDVAVWAGPERRSDALADGVDVLAVA